jgi:hypothetical protein
MVIQASCHRGDVAGMDIFNWLPGELLERVLW